MKLSNLNIGLCITGSFCNFSKLEKLIQELKEENVKSILPIVSYSVLNETNRFSSPKEFRSKIEEITGNEIVDTLSKAEPIGPKCMTDVLLVAPCTGNTLAKISHGITDTPVLMAIKSHIRQNKPVVIALSTNDALGASAENIGRLLNTKNMFFVPFSQDDPIAKPKSIVCNYSKVICAMEQALDFTQIQPIIEK